MGDGTDIIVLGLDDRALLEMAFEIGVHFSRADFFVADSVDALQLVSEGLALRILALLQKSR